MAWKWSRSEERQSGEEWTGFLDKGVRFEGTLEVSGTFRIAGNVKGNVSASQTLIVADGGQVEGQIEGNQIVIAGRFDGVILAKGRVRIEAKGVVTGEIHTPCLEIEPGGIFDGRCHMLTPAEASKPLTIPIRAATQR